MKQRMRFLTLSFLLSVFISGLTLFSLGQVGAAPSEARTQQNVIVNLGQETLTITGTQTYTPTKSFIALNNGAVLTLTLATGGAVEGDTLKIGSEVVTNTVVQATNTSMAAADTISQNDILQFTFFNSQWVLDYSKDNAAD